MHYRFRLKYTLTYLRHSGRGHVYVGFHSFFLLDTLRERCSKGRKKREARSEGDGGMEGNDQIVEIGAMNFSACIWRYVEEGKFDIILIIILQSRKKDSEQIERVVA